MENKESCIPFFSLPDLTGKERNVSELLKEKRHTLFIYFSLLDSLPCIAERWVWPEIAKDENIRVIGIAYHVSERELVDWVRNAKINFLVLFDKDLSAKKQLGFEETPVKIFVNREGEILLKASYKEPISEFQKEMEKIINEK
ncbi:MAG: hypothetical protein WC614_08410 [bacterium]